MLWQHVIAAEPYIPWKVASPPAAWPLIEDLDGDGRGEVILPNRTWDTNRFRFSKEIEVLDGATGQSRWRRSLKMMDPQIDCFLAGPDVNGDGQREIFAATLVGERYDLYVDALSGRDGSTVWWSRRRIGQAALIEDMTRWLPGDDGWPRLLVSLVPEYASTPTPRLIAFSSGTGEFAGAMTEIERLQFADGDGDSLDELFTMHNGRLQAIRGVANERWRRLGGAWQGGADYDGDGLADLVAVFPSGVPAVAAVSGSDGRQLWRTKLDVGPQSWRLWIKPLSIDLDGDQTCDVIVYHGPTGGGSSGPRKQFPVVALSGRTGAKLWTVEMTYANIEGVLFVAARDLDNDGSPEVVFSTFTDWDYGRGGKVFQASNWSQHWLAVVEGRTGQFRWRQSLSVAYGSAGTPPDHTDEVNSADVRPAFADLDRDGVTDVIMPAEVSDSPGAFELRACSGGDGQTLWQRPFALPNDVQSSPPTDLRSLWQNAVTPAVADLDGDGQLELIGLEYFFIASPTSGQQRRVRMFVLDATTGKQVWAWESAVGSRCGQAGDNSVLQTAKPRPLVLARREGRPLLAIGLWGWYQNPPGKIAVLDHAGQLVAEMVVDHAEINYFRPWIHDLNADGNDDVIVLNAGKLTAFQIDRDGERHEFATLWEYPVPPGYNPRIIDVLAATKNDPAIVVVQSGATLYGISGMTGLPRWTNTGPQPLTAGGAQVWTSAQLLTLPATGGPPAAPRHHRPPKRRRRPANSARAASKASRVKSGQSSSRKMSSEYADCQSR